MRPDRERAALLIALGKAADRVADARTELEPFDCTDDETDSVRWDLSTICYSTDLLRKARRHLAAAAGSLRALEADP